MRRAQVWLVMVALVVVGLAACKQQAAEQAEGEETGSPATQAQRAARQQPRPQPVTLPEGTELKVALLSSLSSEQNQEGDTFEGHLMEAVVVNGREVIPRHAKAWGRVSGAVPSGRLKQRAELWVTLTAVEVRGKRVEIATSTAGEKEGSKAKRDIIAIGGGAGIGAAIGGATGGGKGAGIGAAVGAGAGTAAAALTGKRDIQYPPETVIRFVLQKPVTIS